MIKLQKVNLDSICGGVMDAAAYCSSLASISQNNMLTGGTIGGATTGFMAGGCGDLGYTFTVAYTTTGTGYFLMYRAE